VALIWYGKYGAGGLFADVRLVRVAGGGAGGYAVSCLAGRDTAVISEIFVSGALPPDEALPLPDSVSGEVAVWQSVYPFGDDLRAVLLTVWGASALVCDSAVFEWRPDGARSQFWEKLDLLVVPSAGREEILTVRELFRPRLLAVIPPCDGVPPMPNIICGQGEDGGFRYDFGVRRGRLAIPPTP
jgi:hypothetical protein